MSHQLCETSKTLFLVLISKDNFQMLDGPFYLHILYYFILSMSKFNLPSPVHSLKGFFSETPRWVSRTDTAIYTAAQNTKRITWKTFLTYTPLSVSCQVLSILHKISLNSLHPQGPSSDPLQSSQNPPPNWFLSSWLSILQFYPSS